VSCDRRISATTLCLLVAALGFVSEPRPAAAAVTHKFLPSLSAKISEGVPVGCGVEPPLTEPPCVSGAVHGVNAMTADSHHLWIAEGTGSGSRVDRFDTTTGGFLAPQLDGAFLETGVAVGHPEGEEEVYVAAGQREVAVFGPSGTLQHAWTGAATANKSFAERGLLTGVGVDGSASVETRGDVYVSTEGGSESPTFSAVDVFKPSKGGEEPKTVVGEINGPETACVAGGASCVKNVVTREPCIEGEAGCVETFVAPSGVTVSGFNGDVFVADGRSEQCAAGKGECVVDVFEPVSGLPGKYVFLFAIKAAPQGPFKRIGAMAVDASNGNVYVVEDELNVVDEFSREGKYLGRLTGTPAGPFHSAQSVKSVAVDPQAPHGVFVGDSIGSVDAYGEDSVLPDVQTTAASSLTPEGAQLNGAVDPLESETHEPAECAFLWGETEALGREARCPAPVQGSSSQPVSAQLGALLPDTRYFYRLQASNANGTNTGLESLTECEGKPSADACFTTPGPGIHDAWSSEVSSTSVTLNANVDPHGTPLIVFFEYGPTSGYGAETPGEPIGSSSETRAEAHLQSLTPGVSYHYRAVAVDEFGTFRGPDHTFTTQSSTLGLTLPDGRGLQLVSPPDKHGASIQPIGETNVVQASGAGDAISYVAFSPTEQSVPGLGLFERVFSTRAADGSWSSKDISTPHSSPTISSVGDEYRFFSEDLTLGLVEPQGEAFTSLAPEVFPPDTERTEYVRHDTTCTATPATCFQPLLTGAAGYADVPPGTEFGGPGGENPALGAASFVAATPDAAHVILTSRVGLTAGSAGAKNLYEWSAGKPPSEQVRLISALPDGTPAPGTTVATLGFASINAKHAISDDGSRVVWAGEKDAGHLYLRVNATEPQSPIGAQGECTVAADACTLQLDVPQAGCKETCGAGPVEPIFQTASHDLSRVFFTDTQGLTKGSAAQDKHPDLYECQIVSEAGRPACRLRDLTPRGSEDANVQGLVLGASEDGSYVYFVANGLLGDARERGAAPGTCKKSPLVDEWEGSCNVYLSHEGATSLLTVLAGEDSPDWSGTERNLAGHGQTTRVSPSGRYLAFMSAGPLTGYDNRDALNGKPDEEVFLFDALQGNLVCASCDPSGARPIGVEYAKVENRLVGGSSIWPQQQMLAANIPAWTTFGQDKSRYQSRYLSDSGRLFFNSSDVLAPQDSNNNQDVYEYEAPAGTPGAPPNDSCTTASSTYSPVASGCVSLISSGVAQGESAFLDASENGSDVFFLTPERLVPPDTDTALDIYDAHVCSTAAPCLTESSSPPACVTADACRAAPSPQPSIFGAPPSATFSGPGNIAPSPAPRAKTLTRAQRLTAALKACHKIHHHHRRRKRCEASAQRRFGAARKSAAPAHRRSA